MSVSHPDFAPAADAVPAAAVPGDLSDQSVQLARLAAIVESSDDAIVSKTLDGLIVSWNSAAVRLFGYQPEEIIGRSITTIIPPELHAEEGQILERLRQGERIDHFEAIRMRKDGRRLHLSITDADPDVPLAGGGLKVLVVDDNRDAADSCATLLELSGHSVQAAYTGQEALAAAAKIRPHVVVTDIGLPDIDGYEVAAKIKAAPWGRRMVLVAVTGWGQESDKQRALSAGFSHHLTKPIDPDTLESLLRSVAAELGT